MRTASQERRQVLLNPAETQLILDKFFMRRVKTSPVDYLEQSVHNLWKETSLLSFSNVAFWQSEHHKPSAI